MASRAVSPRRRQGTRGATDQEPAARSKQPAAGHHCSDSQLPNRRPDISCCAIAAVIVGGTSFERGNGWLPGTLLGVLSLGVLKNGLNLLAVPSSLQVVSIGLLVIVALLIDSLRGRA